MAQLNLTYLLTGRSVSTELDPHGSTLLGEEVGAAVRAALAMSVIDKILVSPKLIDATLKDGSHLYLAGSFGTSFETTSSSTFLNQISGTISQISEIETKSPSTPRYTLSDISIPVQDYFTNATWADVLKGNDTLKGGIGDDHFIDYGAHNLYQGFAGNDILAAASSGGNVAVYQGKLSEYKISSSASISYDNINNANGFIVRDSNASRDGTDSLVNIDRLKFTDMSVALDKGYGQIGGEAYRLYKAAFDRTPDLDGLASWINALDGGMSLSAVATRFLNSDEFQNKNGGANPSNDTLVTLLYKNVLHRNPDNTGYTAWVNALDSHDLTKEAVLIRFSESDENIKQTEPLIANGIQYHEWWL